MLLQKLPLLRQIISQVQHTAHITVLDISELFDFKTLILPGGLEHPWKLHNASQEEMHLRLAMLRMWLQES